MKSFIFTQSKCVYSRTYGSSTITITVYEIIDNIPHYIGERKFCTASSKSEPSEATTVVLNKYPELLKEKDVAEHVYYSRYSDVFHLNVV